MTRHAYPLDWPEGWKRTPPAERRASAQFKSTFAAARDEMLAELQRLGAADVIISSAIPLRNDGLPRAGRTWQLGRDDPGVAVYFTLRGKPTALACDRYARPSWNLRALGLTVEAMRGIERWGTSGFLERAFAGFEALPAPDRIDWRAALGYPPDARPTADEITARRKQLALHAHPDRGGSDAQMARINRAADVAMKEIQGP